MKQPERAVYDETRETPEFDAFDTNTDDENAVKRNPQIIGTDSGGVQVPAAWLISSAQSADLAVGVAAVRQVRLAIHGPLEDGVERVGEQAF